MTATQRPGKSALDEFLPELDIQRGNHRHSRMDPREIHLEPVGFHPETAEAPLAPIVMETSMRPQMWPMLAAALVGVGVTILAFIGFARFAP